MYAVKAEGTDIAAAKELEKKREYEAAAAMYEKFFKQAPSNILIAQRLIILFRTTGNATKELRYINAAIKLHEKKYILSNKLSNKAASLSRQLNKMLGHTDKKGKPVFVSGDILKLQLRKERLLLNKAKR